MASYILTTCSTTDYERAFFAQRTIPYVCFHYEMDGSEYVDDLYQTVEPSEFYGRLKAGSRSRTSQVGVGEYQEFWKPYLEQGLDVVHVALSSGISGSYNSACLAAADLEERYPDRTIKVVDSLAASSGFGMLVEYMADLRDKGASLDEIVAWAEEHKRDLNHWFFVSDLDCLKRGGRVSATSAVLATALKICPVMDINCLGKLIPRKKIRTKRRAIAELVSVMAERAAGGREYDGKCCISHSDCLEDARAVADLVEEHFEHLRGRVEIHNIGTVIGSHTGPGTVALFFMGRTRGE